VDRPDDRGRAVLTLAGAGQGRRARARHTYVVLRHFWGSGLARPVVRDLDGDGRPELVSRDDRFSA
jgi:hypothetical protein